MRRLGVSRRQLFDELDRPALAALPVEPYVYAEWRQRRVALDYHVDVDGHYYSVPHRLLRQQVEARITERTVELFHKGERVACHLLGGARGRHTTVTEHMPSSHRRHAGWTHERIQREAAAIGPDTATLVDVILRSRPHPEQGFRACLGILRLARQYGVDRLEAACRRGLEIGARSYGSINSILHNGLDRQPLPRASPAPRAAARPSQHPRFPLLPLRRQTLLTHPTVDQLVKLGLAGMARAFTELQDNQSAAGLGHAEWLALLLDREATERSNRQLTARLRHARLRQRATIEDIDWRAQRGLDRTLFQRLIAGDWIEAPHNLIIEGPTGVGKSWLACALGNKACRDNRSVLYQRVPKLFPDLALARGDGRYRRLMKRLGKVRLLILDDWGLEPLRTRPATRSAGDRRGALRPRRNPHHQPDPRRPMARRHRRADHRRRHPRPHRPQRPSPQAQGRLAAQEARRPATQPLDHATDLMPNDNRPEGARHPGRHQSESTGRLQSE